MKTVGYAVVGTGYFGTGLARIMSENEGARIVAVLDPNNAQEIADKLHCDVETDLNAICARSDVDAVIVATPNYLHKEPVLAAARHKKAIFCEKPIALSLPDCQEMIETAKENGVLFMAGHIMNFMNGVRIAKKLINEGKIGRLLFCHAERTGWEDPQPSVSWKKLREKSGGHLYHHIHELDCIQFLMGSAKSVFMAGGNVAHHGEGCGDEDDVLLITMDFGNGTYATMQYGSAFRSGEHFLKIQGSQGAIIIDLQDVKVILRMPEGDTQYCLHSSQDIDDSRTQLYQSNQIDEGVAYGWPGKPLPLWLEDVMKNIMHGMKPDEEFIPLLNGRAASAAIATADACTRSLKENRRVDVSELL